MTWEKKISRKIHKPTYENGYWRMKIIKKLYDKIKSPDIFTVINLSKPTGYAMHRRV